MIIQGDCLDELKKLDDESIDFICTDPPYGYSFMGKDWDKAVPSVEIWQECLRVLKPGAFCCVMSAPRSDVQNAMISRLMDAGFRLDFTPIYWTYASGFPKAGNIGKMVDKRMGAKRKRTDNKNSIGFTYEGNSEPQYKSEAISSEAKQLNGSYAGFQPKPAVEVIIVAMKSLSEKTYVDQALENGKGISWLDDARIPTGDNDRKEYGVDGDEGNPIDNSYQDRKRVAYSPSEQGRFPANLLVSDDMLSDGVQQTGYSRYFDLDKWASTLPFLIVPKASRREKNEGLDDFEEKAKSPDYRKPTGNPMVDRIHGLNKKKNHHPTVKPLKLMSYLITLFSRPGDIVLDPFVGSGTTSVAARKLGRKEIGIERDAEYADIARARLDADKQESLL